MLHWLSFVLSNVCRITGCYLRYYIPPPLFFFSFLFSFFFFFFFFFLFFLLFFLLFFFFFLFSFFLIFFLSHYLKNKHKPWTISNSTNIKYIYLKKKKKKYNKRHFLPWHLTLPRSCQSIHSFGHVSTRHSGSGGHGKSLSGLGRSGIRYTGGGGGRHDGVVTAGPLRSMLAPS